MARRLLLIPLVLALWPAALHAQERPVAFVGATVHPVDRPVITRGVVVVQGGRIAAVGAEGQVAIPADAERVDARGKVILPGLVDTHSHVGGGDGGDRSSPLHPDARLLDSFNPRSPTLRRALAGGITTVNVMPGSGHLMSGQTLYVKLRDVAAARVEDLLFCGDVLTGVCGGMKMANGTNSIGNPPFPGTRARSAAAVRALYTEARAYRDRRANPDSTKRGARDLRMDALAEVLDGRRTVHFHTHRADDIMTVLRLAREFGYRPVLQHVSEGWKVAPQIAAAGLPASVIVLDSPGGKLEAAEVRFETAGILDRAGVKVAIHTDDYVTDSRMLLRSTALAVRAGLSREGAIRALTLNGAEMMGLEGRLGTLTPGKDADLVVLSGDPFSVYTQVLETWVEGRKLFDRSRPEDRAYALGGYGTYDPSDNHVHSDDERD
jgi:imidazolonepropionase-like amidohydrolase